MRAAPTAGTTADDGDLVVELSHEYGSFFSDEALLPIRDRGARWAIVLVSRYWLNPSVPH